MSQSISKKIISRTILTCIALTALLGLLQETDSMDCSWTLIVLPLFISFGLLIPYTYIYVSDTCSSLKSNSLLLILILLYFFILSLFVFTLVLALKADDYISSSWYSVFIPLWFSIFTASFFTIFMMPGLLDPSVKLYREAWTLLSINLAVIISSIMLAAYLENDLEYLWAASLPLFITLSVCFVVFLYFEYKKGEILWALTDTEFFIYASAIGASIIGIANDENNSIPNYSFFILLLVCACSQIIAYEIRELYSKDETKEEIESMNMIEENDLD